MKAFRGMLKLHVRFNNYRTILSKLSISLLGVSTGEHRAESRAQSGQTWPTLLTHFHSRKIGFRRTEVIPLRGPASAAVAYK